MPFLAENRLIGGERLAVISRVLPSTDLSVVGDWLAPGLLLYTVNGADIQQSGNVTAAVLNAMQVDPDGRARVVVEYSGAALERQAGLLTVDVVRLISLANGLNVTFRNRDGVWQAEVTAVLDPSLTDLRQGDILFRDRTTGVALAQPETLEAILVSLVEAGVGTTEFSIIRDNRVEAATMQLARAADP